MKLTIDQAVFNPEDLQIIDTHVHYNLPPLLENWSENWQKAQQAGVQASVIASIDLPSSQQAVKIAKQADNLWALVGIHPSEVSNLNFDKNKHLLTEIDGIITGNSDDVVLGIGEIGLDYYWIKQDDFQARENQRQWLRAQLQFARQRGGWISLHVRDQQAPAQPTANNAYWDLWEVISEFEWPQPGNNLILHCVSGPPPYIEKMVRLGAYVGFDGNLTYAKADQLRQIWQMVPANKRLLETDAPYLPPEPYRGQTCEPWMITKTAQYARQNLK